jgi:phosphoadenosine phosphosulfate reductase
MSANLEARISSALGWLECAASRPRPAFSSSFGAEDMVLLDLIVRHALPIDIFTLDTGRLPEETHALMRGIEQRYGHVFTVCFPEAQAVSQLIAEQGSNGFYESVDKRRACCAVRKVQPLQRALAGRGAWVTGQRAAQSATRTALQALEPDSRPGVLKVNPLHDWSEDDVWAYLRVHEVPVNALHARRFPSIGCAPCTRAITAGEDVRAGRWWWEEPGGKECGLHAPAAQPVQARRTPVLAGEQGVQPAPNSEGVLHGS